MAAVLRGLQDFFDALQPQEADSGVGPPLKHRAAPFAAGGFVQAWTTPRSAPVKAVPLPPKFEEAWKAHCATNPRLRDPKALPALLRRGVPDQLRAEVWMHCLGIDKAVLTCASGGGGGNFDGMEAESELDRADDAAVAAEAPELSAGLSDLIEADVLRTFSGNAAFQESGGPDKLRRVLHKLAAADADVGYCQSMNFLAALFIMVLQSEPAALAAVRHLLVRLGTRSWYTDGMLQLRADTSVLEELIAERLPIVHEAFRTHRFDLIIVSSKWFLCLFVTTLEGEALRRVWDVMLCDGIEVIFRVALALLSKESEQVAKARSMDDLVLLFQQPTPTGSPEALIEAAYRQDIVGCFSRADLAQRRQRAARRVSSADASAEMRITQLKRGGVRPASLMSRP